MNDRCGKCDEENQSKEMLGSALNSISSAESSVTSAVNPMFRQLTAEENPRFAQRTQRTI